MKKEADCQLPFLVEKGGKHLRRVAVKEKLHYAKLCILASIPEVVTFCNAVVVHAAEATSGNTVTQKVQKSSTSIWATMKLISISLVVVVLGVCGIVLMIGTQKMKDGIKEHFYSIAAGVAVLFLAKDIADWCEDIFG